MQPSIFAFTSLQDVEAVVYTWRSPAAQVSLQPAGSQGLKPAVRAVAMEPAKPLLQVAALQAFWSLEQPPLVKLASHLGARLPSGARVFDILFALVSHVLPHASMSEVMNICCKRLASFERKMQWSDEYAELDEAVQVLAREDQENLTSQKKASESARALPWRLMLSRLATGRSAR
eukprot:9904948-Alexandrium_andersonii.AAC.1